jgi:anti-anti-sigma factor
MGDRVDNGFGHGPTDAWLAAAKRAVLGDMTLIGPTPWATAVSVSSEAGVHVVRVGGELATGSAAYLDLVLEQEISAAPQALIVDLSDATFIGARGIAALLRAADRARENDTTLCLAAPIYPDLRSQLRTLSVAELFDEHSSVAECRWALSRREPTLSPQMPPRRDESRSRSG